MANGRPYRESEISVATRDYPLGTWLRITNQSTGQQVVAEVTDRPRSKRGIDLSLAAYKELGFSEKQGVGWVQVERASRGR